MGYCLVGVQFLPTPAPSYPNEYVKVPEGCSISFSCEVIGSLIREAESSIQTLGALVTCQNGESRPHR